MRAYAQYLLLGAGDHLTSIPKPENPSTQLPQLLALLGTSGLTAAIGLSEAARIKSGETVLITAAAGGLGHIAAQWAALQGARVVAVVGSEAKRAFLEKISERKKFERIINYRSEDLSAVLKTEYPVCLNLNLKALSNFLSLKSGLDVIWETVGTPLFEQLFEHLGRRGRLVNVGATAGYQTVGYRDISIENFIAKVKEGFFCKEKLFNQFFSLLATLRRPDRDWLSHIRLQILLRVLCRTTDRRLSKRANQGASSDWNFGDRIQWARIGCRRH